jgi:hypothetical protein
VAGLSRECCIHYCSSRVVVEPSSIDFFSFFHLTTPTKYSPNTQTHNARPRCVAKPINIICALPHQRAPTHTYRAISIHCIQHASHHFLSLLSTHFLHSPIRKNNFNVSSLCASFSIKQTLVKNITLFTYLYHSRYPNDRAQSLTRAQHIRHKTDDCTKKNNKSATLHTARSAILLLIYGLFNCVSVCIL